MVKKLKYLDIPCEIDYGGKKISGLILQMNLTGIMVEVPSIPFKVGQIVPVMIGPGDERLSISEKVRSVKNYDNFYRAQITEDDKVVREAKRIAELHFIKVNEVHRQKIVRYLGRRKLQG